VNLRAKKAEIRQRLLERDLEAVATWATKVRNPLRILFSLTYDSDNLVRWRAVEAVGTVTRQLAPTGSDKLRDFVRRMLWQMNDESGGLSWLAPELVGEVLVNAPDLLKEFSSMLPSYLVEEPFERGTHLAIYRLASIRPELFTDCLEQLMRSLDDPDPNVRGLAALAVGTVDREAGAERLKSLRTDSDEIELYNFDNGQFEKFTVGQLARQALGEESPEQAA
jgi:hypothetical protein